MSNEIYLSLGANLGDKLKNLNDAIASLKKHLEVTSISKIFKTEPWGNLDQPSFYNMCIKANCILSPQELLKTIKDIELELGRTKTEHWGPRLIDIDILFFNDLILKEEDLVIPHPFLHERSFVLVPLNEIASDFIHPILKNSVSKVSKELKDTSKIEAINV